MAQPGWNRRSLLIALTVFAMSPQCVFAIMPTNPVSDREFTLLPNGKDLRTISVNGSPLTLARGSGQSFGSSQQANYLKLKQETLTSLSSKTQWTLMDLDDSRVIAESLNSKIKIFGASSSKIFVGGTLLDKQQGSLTNSQLQLMSDMLVVSSNEAWVNLQSQIGNGDANKGRATNLEFTQRMGYPLTRGFQGYLGPMHGNELTASETAQYLNDIYKNKFPGAETLWKLMHACRTGADRGRKYIPSSLYVGAKTGTYDGPTVDPQSGREINVAIRNHVLVFNLKGHQYGLVILSNGGSDEAVAVLAGGLIREYIGL